MPTQPDGRARPVVLCILDGWGLSEKREDNALALARTPVWNRLMAECAHARIATSGPDVGLPAGQMGNSEVGHMNIGAGRIAVPELARVETAIADGSFAANPVLHETIARSKKSRGRLHVMGLLSPGGVHSHQDHMAALARAAASAGVPVLVHAFLDGRDTPPQSASEYVAAFLRAAGPKAAATIAIASITGRYYAMDRDKRWERVAAAYKTLTEGGGLVAKDAGQAIAQAYGAGKTDEFVPATSIAGYDGMKDGDGLIMANFRADRAREILTALLDPGFNAFPRQRQVKFAAVAGMVEYSTELARLMPALFPPVRFANTLGELVARADMKQLRIAETEKYAHVTFFLNGGEEAVFPGEDRILVPSPKVATYDLKPEMSAPEVTDRLVAAIASGHYDLIVVNYANADMVGHSGVLAAAIKAAECIDACLGRLDAAVVAAGGVLLITADHGNLEEMRDHANGQPHTQHTLNVVPAVLAGPGAKGFDLVDGRLADIAPTLLPLLGLKQPGDMTGRSLLRPTAKAERRRHA
jgi:2,3-bisphosphoglycerate-independent phosphoglycerate mutase